MYRCVLVQPVTEDIAATLKLSNARGVIVSQIQLGSPAERAGLKRGDVILALNGNIVSDPNNFRNEIAGTPPEQTVTLRIWRDGSEQEVRSTLGEFAPEERIVTGAELGSGIRPSDARIAVHSSYLAGVACFIYFWLQAS